MIFFAFTVGVLASALGLGGGVVFNPLLIELGVPPQISSATGMFLVLFASLSNSILYSLADDLSCNVDEDCNQPFSSCDLELKECVHKNIFPMEDWEFAGVLVLTGILALCNAAGIGGGGIIVPIGIILFKFDTTHAIALSNFNIFISSILRYVMNFGDRHPERGSVMVNYEIAMIMLPMVLLGGMIGVQINYILPDAVILGLLTLLLIYMGWKVTNTGFKKWNEENHDEDAPLAHLKVSSLRCLNSKQLLTLDPRIMHL